MEQNEKNTLLSGFSWKFAERIASQGVSFVIGIVLARILMPEQYGVVALIQIFITISNVFVTSGFSTSLIQKKDADNLDFSTIMYCSLGVALVLYAIIYFSAPFIADFYNNEDLIDITRVYSFILIPYSYNSVQTAYVSRKMIFKKSFWASLSGTLLSGIIGLYMAYNGYGVWAIVYQAMLNVVFNMIVLFAIIDWRPRFEFSFVRAKSLMSYGSKVLGADLIGSVFNELQQLLIGKMYLPADLALFNRGKQIPNLVTTNIDTAIGQVLFPAMSNHSDEPEVIKSLTRKSIKVSSYLMFFLMSLLALIAEPLIRIMLTDKWIDSVPFLQMVCLSGMISTVSTANMQAIKASGNSGVLLKLELIKKPIYLALILCGAFISVYAIALTFPIYAIIAAIVNMWPNKRILDYSIGEQVKDLLPATIIAFVAFGGAWSLNWFISIDWLLIVIQSLVFLASYFILSKFAKVEAFLFLSNMIKDQTIKKR